MTHGYEFFEYEYENIDFYDWLLGFEEETISDFWAEMEKTYSEYLTEVNEYDIYEQNEEEEEE